MNQLALFGEPTPTPTVQSKATNEWWLGTVEERREGNLRSAEFWQREHDKSGLPITQESIYAANLRKMADDMGKRPDYYERKPVNVSDFQWWLKREQQQ